MNLQFWNWVFELLSERLIGIRVILTQRFYNKIPNIPRVHTGVEIIPFYDLLW